MFIVLVTCVRARADTRSGSKAWARILSLQQMKAATQIEPCLSLEKAQEGFCLSSVELV